MVWASVSQNPATHGVREVEKDEEIVCRELQNHTLPSATPSAKVVHIEYYQLVLSK